MEGISKKIYLELDMPTEEDSRSDRSAFRTGWRKRGFMQ